MTYTQAQIDRAARMLAEHDGEEWKTRMGGKRKYYIRLATEVARELDGGA